MNRITGRLQDVTIFIRSKDGESGTGYFTTQERLPEIIRALTHYEDTELTPEQIREIDKLYAEKCRELAEARKKLSKYRRHYVADGDLPNNGQEVLACIKHIHNDCDGWRTYRQYEYQDGWWIGMGNMCKVIYWVELPDEEEQA